MTDADDKTGLREQTEQTLMTRLMQPVTVSLPAYGLVAAAVAVFALVVVAID